MKVRYRRAFMLILSAVILISLVGCSDNGRDYREDICISLEGREGELVIREWSFLMGSGAEIYYRQDGEMTLLGKTNGGDDGYCPFADGKYSVFVDGETVLIKWVFLSDNGVEIWRKETFTLPS